MKVVQAAAIINCLAIILWDHCGFGFNLHFKIPSLRRVSQKITFKVQYVPKGFQSRDFVDSCFKLIKFKIVPPQLKNLMFLDTSYSFKNIYNAKAPLHLNIKI